VIASNRPTTRAAVCCLPCPQLRSPHLARSVSPLAICVPAFGCEGLWSGQHSVRVRIEIAGLIATPPAIRPIPTGDENVPLRCSY
jgi:hypothetical protein